MKTRTQKTLDEMADSAVLAMALDDMEFLGLIKWKPDAESFTERRSLADQVRQLLGQAAAKVEPITATGNYANYNESN